MAAEKTKEKVVPPIPRIGSFVLGARPSSPLPPPDDRSDVPVWQAQRSGPVASGKFSRAGMQLVRRSARRRWQSVRCPRAGEEVAVKLEAVETRHPQLLYESRVYRSLAGAEGVPAVRWCGVEGDHNARSAVESARRVLTAHARHS